jgi:hypothetical protein
MFSKDLQKIITTVTIIFEPFQLQLFLLLLQSIYVVAAAAAAAVVAAVVAAHQFNFVPCPIRIQHEIPALSSGCITKSQLFILHSLIDILSSMFLFRFIGRFAPQNVSAVLSVLLVSVSIPTHIIL